MIVTLFTIENIVFVNGVKEFGLDQMLTGLFTNLCVVFLLLCDEFCVVLLSITTEGKSAVRNGKMNKGMCA